MIEDIVKKLINTNTTITTAESITGGLLAKLITDVPGSSKIYHEGFIVYSNDSKINMLDVDPYLIDKYGVVSKEVARDMAIKLKSMTASDICISTTGNAGPDVCDDKPVGRVYIGIDFLDEVQVYECDFSGNRNDIRNQTAEFIFNHIDKLVVERTR